MTVIALAPTLASRIAALFAWTPSQETRHPRDRDDCDDARACRDFLSEMLRENPQAFASELDVQSMMNVFPGRY